MESVVAELERRSRLCLVRAVEVALLTFLFLGLTYAVTYHYSIRHYGQIQAIGLAVYAEDAQTVLTELNWGDVYVGNTYYSYAFLKSTSSVNSTVQYAADNLPSYLTFTLYYQTGYWSNSVWQPTSDWINMESNPYLIQPGEWLRLRFGLTISESATVGPFSFTIIISATS
jgi:hypothetical protein